MARAGGRVGIIFIPLRIFIPFGHYLPWFRGECTSWHSVWFLYERDVLTRVWGRLIDSEISLVPLFYDIFIADGI